ncbi:MAG: ribonuclease P protein component [Candidatus Marinimicrobia bacterium]|nr:ribonuclease P protein component [Candidatus Neomarinimicrobiota bacterium]
MVVDYWPAAVPREENTSPFPVKHIDRATIADYLKSGRRFTMRGITLYTKPTDILEVGFLIRRRAGNAVRRNKTRRLFNGLLLNAIIPFLAQRGYLFLFHRSFFSGSSLATSVQLLVKRSQHATQ